MKNKRIASEWLFFVGAFLFGILALPILILPFLFSVLEWGNYLPIIFYKSLFSHDWMIAWGITLGPYILVQFIRSIVWSVKILKEDSD
ncbi:hypothetical protein DDZ13_14970 [Coraliomargarita sinensis]|uniref:Uncharacterized protein n=1 Tax=Coraliomargarita sinensis TaxID=2174842 RepID=A0A317ZCI7_9BACT|nr:hypothetical protein DDZ13_14970 [Coraliomargarita sinensis]